MSKVFIGIDCDVTKSGLAYYYPESKNFVLKNLSFFELFDELKMMKQTGNEITVIIEAGWLNKSNWHAVNKGSAAINAQIGQRTGANHETGKKIAEMCEYLQLKYELKKPSKAKMDSKTFNAITGVSCRTNQEQRDAGILIYGRK